MKWRCTVQHKSAKSKGQWTQLVPTEGPFHRDYRQVAAPSVVKARSQRQMYHRFLQNNPNWSADQRSTLSRDPLIIPRTRLNQPNHSQANGNLPPTKADKKPATTIPLRLLWLRAEHVDQPKIVGLRHRFGNEGMDIHLADVRYLPNQHENSQHENSQLDHLFPAVFDLIVLECVEVLEGAMLMQLSDIREVSQAPLIVLTDNYTLDWSLRALSHGADAIFTLNTPDDVIVARSNALLRRWT